jgi:putative transposase
MPYPLTKAFQRLLAGAGIETIFTPPSAPNCNAYAERFVRSIKEECLNRMIFFGEASLRRALPE